MAESQAVAAASLDLTLSAQRTYPIDHYYSTVAGASEDQMRRSYRADQELERVQAAYALERWVEEVQGREEKYDRLATLARAAQPLRDLIQHLSAKPLTGVFDLLDCRDETLVVGEWLRHRRDLHAGASPADSVPAITGRGQDPIIALRMIVIDPDGRDDYAVWFQIGWLLWRRGNLIDATDAFKTAAHHSEPSPWYTTQSLRHQAHIHYLQADYEGARTLALTALNVDRPWDLLFEAARYACLCGEPLEMIDLLEEAVTLRPLLISSVLTEPEFSSHMPALVELAVRLQTRANSAAYSEHKSLLNTRDLLREAEGMCGLKLLSPDSDQEPGLKNFPADMDFACAGLYAEHLQTTRLTWRSDAFYKTTADTRRRAEHRDRLEENYRQARAEHQTQIRLADEDQRGEEQGLKEQREQVPSPVLPKWGDEIARGVVLGLFVLAAGAAALALASQMLYGSVPPLNPIPKTDWFVIAPVLVLMFVFGVLGGFTFPLMRIRHIQTQIDDLHQKADLESFELLRAVAAVGARRREELNSVWTGREVHITEDIAAAEGSLRAAQLSLAVLKKIEQ